MSENFPPSLRTRCHHCGGPFGLRRYPPVRTRRDVRQFCSRDCARAHRLDLILKAYWQRMRLSAPAEA